MAYTKLRLLTEASNTSGFDLPQQVAMAMQYNTSEPIRSDRILIPNAGLVYALNHMTEVQWLAIYNEDTTEQILSIYATFSLGAPEFPVIYPLDFAVITDIDPATDLDLASSAANGSYIILLYAGV